MQFVGTAGTLGVVKKSDDDAIASIREHEAHLNDHKIRVFKRIDGVESEFIRLEKVLRDELEVQDIRSKRAMDSAVTVARSGWKLLDDRVVKLESGIADSRIPALSEGYAKLADRVDNVDGCQRRLIKSLDAHHASHESLERRIKDIEYAPKPKNNEWALFCLTLFTSAFGFAAFLKIFFFQ